MSVASSNMSDFADDLFLPVMLDSYLQNPTTSGHPVVPAGSVPASSDLFGIAFDDELLSADALSALHPHPGTNMGTLTPPTSPPDYAGSTCSSAEDDASSIKAESVHSFGMPAIPASGSAMSWTAQQPMTSPSNLLPMVPPMLPTAGALSPGTPPSLPSSSAYAHPLFQAPPMIAQQSHLRQISPSPPPQQQQQQQKSSSGRPTKKSSHNAIEKRYRNSINDKIQELKNMLPPSEMKDSKLNKASVLKKSIDYIRRLGRRNSMLEKQVQQLQERLSRYETPPPPVTDHTVLMCVLLFGFLAFGSISSSAMSSTAYAAPSAPGSRVLSSTETADVEGGSDATHSLWAWVHGALISWVLRGVVCLVCLALLFMREPVTQADSQRAQQAQEHEKKSVVAASVGDTASAKAHAVKALECLQRPLPTSHTDLFLGLTWQLFRQALHRLWFGQVLDRFFSSRSSSALSSARTASMALFHYHQLHLKSNNSGTDSKQTLPRALVALQALNLAEAVSHTMDAVSLAQIYVAAAAELELTFGGQASMVSRFYLHRAKLAFRASVQPHRAKALSWLFTPKGNDYFKAGSWAVRPQVIVAPSSPAPASSTLLQVMPPGSLEQLGVAFRINLMDDAARAFISGSQTASAIGEQLEQLHIYALNGQDSYMQWWALMGQVATSWRQGQQKQARNYFIKAEASVKTRDPLQDMLYVAFRAQQALLDGSHMLCWQACACASKLLHEDAASYACPPEYAFLAQAARHMSFRVLLSTRVALYRLRAYLSRVSNQKLPEIAVKVSATSTDGSGDNKRVKIIDLRAMLAAAQDDVCSLRAFAESFPPAQPLLFMNQAICRSLAGGRVMLTEHLFHKSIKAAKRYQLCYDEAAATLNFCAFLRPSLTVGALRQHLAAAGSQFQRCQALDELTAVRKLTKLIESEV